MASLVCTSCEVQIPSSQRTDHYRSEWHRYNVKRRCAGLSHIPEALFTQKLTALKTMQDGEKEAKVNQKCITCNKTFSGASSYKQHLSSKRHLTRANNRNAHKKSTNTEATQDSTQDAVKDETPTPTPAAPVESKVQFEKMDDGKEDENEGDEGEYEFDESKIIPLGTCLFCNKKCKTVKKSLDHMLKKHGFFIPFIEYLKDLDKLMEYLGAKVGVGHVCLYCNGRGKTYTSLQAVQNHMIAKCHCKIRIDDDDDEFLEFYDFPQKDLPPWMQEEDEGDEGEEMKDVETTDDTKDGAEKKKPKRQLEYINNLGEIVMTDGAIIGHRSLNRAYRQNTQPTTRHDELLALMGDYRALRLDGYDGNRKAKFNEVKHVYQQKRHREVLKYQFRSNNIKRFVDATET